MKTEPIEGLGFLLHDAARAIQRRFEERVGTEGLSAAQWRLLARLVKAEGLPQARLAAMLEIEPISVSRLLDRMEDGGWIERRPDPSDRRVRMVFATRRSRSAFDDIRDVAHDIYDTALHGLSAEERRHLAHGLKTVISNLSNDETTIEQGCKTPASREYAS